MKHKTSHRRPTRKLLTCALASCLMLSAPAFAQSSNATLRGKAPAGAQVTATNTATGLSRKVVANADGSYALVGLPPGTYKVDAGAGTEQTVTLAVATSVSLNLAGGAPAPSGDATTLDTVRVTAPPLTEVKTSEVGANVSLKQINTVPQLTRNFLEFADTVPGMQFSTDASGHSSIRGGAQQTSAVNVYIDGVGQKSYLFGGVSGQEQSAGNPFPQLAIGEYKVITSNYKAEFDQVGSAAIVAATKSGGNEFHGEVFGRHTDSSWRAQTVAEAAPGGGDKESTHQNEYGFALGGPIIQDKMHFFVSYEGKGFVIPDNPVAITNGPFLSYADDLPASVQAKYGPVTRPFNEDLYFGKIDWEIGDNDRLELTAKLRREDSVDSVGGNTTKQAAKINDNTEDRYDLLWQHYGDSYFNEARITYEDVLFNPTAGTIGSQRIYTAGQNENDTLIFDDATSGLSIQHKGQKGPAFQDDLTFNSFSWHGDHVIKMGVKYKDIELTQSENSILNPSFYYAVTDGVGTADIPYQVKFNYPFAGFSPSVTTKSKQYGLYIQDDWDVTDKLQLNLGVRWDYEKTPSYLNFRTPQAVVDAINTEDPNNPGHTFAETLAAGGLDINNYISTGHNRKADKNNIAPRLGFSYDFNGDESWVMFGGAGRSYDRNLYDYLGLEQVKGALTSYTVHFLESGSCDTLVPQECVNWNPSYLTGIDAVSGLVVDPASRAGTEVDMLNNDLKTPYSDQYSLGIRHSMGDWNTSATAAYVHSKEGFAFTLGSRWPNGDFWQGGSQPWNHNAEGLGTIILGDNGIETKTKQLLLSAEKPYTKASGWGFTASYTFSDAKGNRGDDQHYSFDAARIQQYPFIDLKSVPKHRLVMTGIYDLPWNMTLSGKLTLATTPPLNEVVNYAGVPNPTPVAITNMPGEKFLIGGPIFGTRQLDLSLSKDMYVTKDVTVQVRGDLINAFNWENYSSFYYTFDPSSTAFNPAVIFNDTNTSTSYSPPRTLFMSVRVIW